MYVIAKVSLYLDGGWDSQGWSSSMTSSMQLAQECLKDPPEASEEPPAQLEGLEMFAQTIETGESKQSGCVNIQTAEFSSTTRTSGPICSGLKEAFLVCACSPSSYKSHLYRHHYSHRAPAPGPANRCGLRGSYQTVGPPCSCLVDKYTNNSLNITLHFSF